MAANTKFLDYIFAQNSNSNDRDWLIAFDSIQARPEQITTIIRNPSYRLAFFTDFTLYGNRLVEFIDNAKKDDKPAISGMFNRLGRYMIELLIIPLLGDEYRHLIESPTCFELVLSTLHWIDQDDWFYHGGDFRRLAACLTDVPGILGQMISSNRCHQLLPHWIHCLGGNGDSATLKGWAQVASSLLISCPKINHHGHDATENWRSLKSLQTWLQQLSTMLSQYPDLDFQFPEAISEQLDELRLPKPTSIDSLSATIHEVDIKLSSLELIQDLTKSFPCDTCFRGCIGNGLLTQQRRIQPGAFHTEEISNAVENPVSGPLTQRTWTQTGAFDVEGMSISFENLLGSSLGLWKISLSAQAMKDLQQSQSEGNFEHIMSKLVDLSSGDWLRRSLAKPITMASLHFKVPIFGAIYGSNGRILWQVDCGYDERQKANSQIVRVWRIGDVKEMQSCYGMICRTQGTWSAEKIASCKINNIANKIKIPAILGGNVEDGIDHAEAEVDDSSLVPGSESENLDDTSSLDTLVLGKFHTLTSRVFENILLGNEHAEFPFDVNQVESNIIKHFRTAAFILGRSGTGKTTCLLYKLLIRNLSWMHQNDPEGRINQVLLTRSEGLARKLRSELQRLIHTQMFQGNETGATLGENSQENLRAQTLFSLRPEQFPLVCTFSDFMAILRNSILPDNSRPMTIGSSGRDTVDFTIFKAVYWPSCKPARKMDPGLVFSEIMGVIKGSASSNSGFLPLSRHEYINLSPRLAPLFPTENEREQLYDSFLTYERMKKSRGDFDDIDKLTTIFKALVDLSPIGAIRGLLQEIYVDEVQDQRTMEIDLLLHMVQDPRGIHFAGDTAQCISNDSAFRFENVKSLFYNHYHHIDPELAKPKLFALSTNFRSHQGILSLASYVMELLWRGFPNLVDKLSPEVGPFSGPRPIVFVGRNILELLLMAGNANSASDKQVIIVRDDESKVHLQTKIGMNALIFTILESKGMEYDDVYIYDFFASSPNPSGWRTIDELLSEGVSFSYANQNMVMCSELRNLYVAITRPRRRLWMLESVHNHIMESFTTKRKRPLVDIRYFESDDLESILPDLRPTSVTTPEEWVSTGEQCMDRGIYDQALRCFQNAGDQEKCDWAYACMEEKQGREYRAKGQHDKFQECFENAIIAYKAARMMESAANCHEALGNFAKAAAIWSTRGQHKRAGELYATAGKTYVVLASEEYYKANLPIMAINLLLQMEEYEKAVHGLMRYRGQLPRMEYDKNVEKCNELLSEGLIDKSLEKAIFDLLISDEKRKAFLKSHRNFDELWTFLGNRNMLDEALDELISADEFDLVLKRSTEASKDWQMSHKNELAEVYHAVNVRRLMAEFAKEREVDIQPIFDSSYDDAIWAQGWTTAIGNYGPLIKAGKLPTRLGVCERDIWAVDLLTTIAMIYPTYFTNQIDTISDFQVILQHAQFTAQQLAKSRFTAATYACLGVIHKRQTKGYRCVPWSILPKDSSIDVSTLVKFFLKESMEEFGRQMLKAINPFLQKVELFTRCIKKVTEKNDEESKQRCNHTSHLATRNSRFLKGLITIACKFWEIQSIWSTTSIKTCGEDCVKTLLEYFTYYSAHCQDVRVIQSIAKDLSTEEGYAVLLGKLRDTAFKDLIKIPNGRDKLAPLRSYSLLQVLGTNLPDKLETYRGTKGVKSHIDILRFYHELISTPNAEDGQMYHLVDSMVSKLLNNLEQYLQELYKRDVHYAVEIIALCEDIATLLLFHVRQNDILMPNSWAVMYLPHWSHFSGPTTPLERASFLDALIRLTLEFCRMINSIEKYQEGRPGKFNDELARRSVNFLLVMLINIGMAIPQPVPMDMFEGVQKVIGYEALKTAEIYTIKHPTHLKPLLETFQSYNGNDHLCIYICKERPVLRFSPTTTWLKKLGIQIRPMPKCTSEHTGCKTKAMENAPFDIYISLCQINSAYFFATAYQRRKELRIEKLTPFVISIQRACRIALQRRAENRARMVLQPVVKRYMRDKEYRRSNECSAVRKIQELLEEKRASYPQISGKEYLTLVGIMVTEGVELFIELEEVHKLYDTVRAQKHTKLSTGMKKKFGSIKKRIDDPWGKLFQSKTFVALGMSEKTLRGQVEDGLKMVEDVKNQLNRLDENGTARVTPQIKFKPTSTSSGPSTATAQSSSTVSSTAALKETSASVPNNASNTVAANDQKQGKNNRGKKNKRGRR